MYTKELNLKQLKRNASHLYEIVIDTDFDTNNEELMEDFDAFLTILNGEWLMLTGGKYDAD